MVVVSMIEQIPSKGAYQVKNIPSTTYYYYYYYLGFRKISFSRQNIVDDDTPCQNIFTFWSPKQEKIYCPISSVQISPNDVTSKIVMKIVTTNKSEINKLETFLKSRPLFLYFRLFNTVGDSKKMFNVNFAEVWIRTADLWCRKLPLYQLRHNHCP